MEVMGIFYINHIYLSSINDIECPTQQCRWPPKSRFMILIINPFPTTEVTQPACLLVPHDRIPEHQCTVPRQTVGVLGPQDLILHFLGSRFGVIVILLVVDCFLGLINKYMKPSLSFTV